MNFNVLHAREIKKFKEIVPLILTITSSASSFNIKRQMLEGCSTSPRSLPIIQINAFHKR